MNGLPSDAGMFIRIQVGFLERRANTIIVAAYGAIEMNCGGMEIPILCKFI